MNYKHKSSKIINFILYLIQIALAIAFILWMVNLTAKDVQTIGIKEVKATTFNPCDLQVVDCDNEYKVWTEYIEYEGTVEEQIRAIAKDNDFKWTDYLIKLATCESNLNPKVVNGKNNYPASSKDRGVLQINDYWHSEIDDDCAFSVSCSTRFTMDMINKGRQKEWVCSKYI